MSLSKFRQEGLNFIGNKNFFWVGLALVFLGYSWFFSSKERNVQTVVEGAQLFFVFGLSAVLTIYLSKSITSTRK